MLVIAPPTIGTFSVSAEADSGANDVDIYNFAGSLDD